MLVRILLCRRVCVLYRSIAMKLFLTGTICCIQFGFGRADRIHIGFGRADRRQS